ncbi:MAG: hypothetical protein SGPRY_013422 [Prymnesium sp.]
MKRFFMAALCVSLLPALEALQPRAPTAGLSPPLGLRGSLIHASLPRNSILADVTYRRKARTIGLIGGVGMLGGAVGVGTATGTLDGSAIAVGGAAATMLASAVGTVVSLSYNEESEPIGDACFRVQDSAAGKGQGLFASAPIAAGSYLFPYEGERLTEEQFFERYPDANGRYVACIDGYLPWMAPSYIDGADPSRSGLARWMNHSSRRPNVRWKKQRFGSSMYFYAACPIESGEELMFDYGDAYWSALGVQPIED